MTSETSGRDDASATVDILEDVTALGELLLVDKQELRVRAIINNIENLHIHIIQSL
jgi:hypothetical protein